MRYAYHLRLWALAIAFVAATTMGATAAAAGPDDPQPTPTIQRVCQQKERRCIPKKLRPQKLEHPREDCRWDAYYPTVKDKVRCVVYYNGQIGNWGTWQCIAWNESRWNPYAIGDAGERGIFQIHPVNFDKFDEDRLWDPVYNAYAAMVMYRLAGGFGPWTTMIFC